MTIVCGKFFFHKKHKIPKPDEIKDYANESNLSELNSYRTNQENTYSNYQPSTNESSRAQKNNLNEDNMVDYSKGFSNLDEIKDSSNKENKKTKALNLNMNYSSINDDSTSRISKALKSQYFELPPDSFFANKLAAQPDSTIKIHHKRKKKLDQLPEIPPNVLNRRLNYQYTSPTKTPIEALLIYHHKKPKKNANTENNDNEPSPNNNLLATPESSKRKSRISKNQIKSNVVMFEEEEEEVGYENDQVDSHLLANNKPVYSSSNEEYNKLSFEEEEMSNDHNQKVIFNTNNAKNFTSYSNSYKSTSSSPNEEQSPLSSTGVNRYDQLKNIKNSIATSPFYKPNMQLQQFAENDEVSELLQSQIVKPPQSGQPNNLSRNNRIKAATKAKSGVYPSNNNTNSVISQIVDEQINLRQGKGKSPNSNSSKPLSSKSSKPNSPKIANEQIIPSEETNRSPIYNSSNNYSAKKSNLKSYQHQNEQTSASSSAKKSPKSTSQKYLSPHSNFGSPQIINDQADSKSNKSPKSVSSKNSYAMNDNFELLQMQNEQVMPNSFHNKSPKSNSSKSNSSPQYNSESSQSFNDHQSLNLSNKKSQSSSSSSSNSLNMKSKIKSPNILNEQTISGSNKKKSISSNSSTKSLNSHSKSPKSPTEQAVTRSGKKKSSNSNTPKNSSSASQTASDSFQSESGKNNSKSSKKKSPKTNSAKKSPPIQNDVQIDDEDDGEPIFFERLQISEKDVSYSGRSESDEQRSNDDKNSQNSNENEQLNNYIQNEEEQFSEKQSLHNVSAIEESNQKNENFGLSHSINDFVIEEEEEEIDESIIQMRNEEKSIVVLSELQNNADISPLPKKKASGYMASFHQLTTNSLNVNESETEINNSLVQILKTESKDQKVSASPNDNSNKSIILTNDEIDEKSDEEEVINSARSFSSIAPSSNKINCSLAKKNNLNNNILQASFECPLTEEEEEDNMQEDEVCDGSLNLLDSRISDNESDINTIQDVIFEEDFNVIPNDSKLLDSDDSQDAESDSEVMKNEFINHEIDDEFLIQNPNEEKKISNSNALNISNNLFSDSESSNVDFPRILNNEIEEEPLVEKKSQDQFEKIQNYNNDDDVHSSEIRFLIESSSEQSQKREKDDDNDYQEIQCLSPKFLREAIKINLEEEDEEEEEENKNNLFDVNDSPKKEQKHNSSYDALLDTYINSSFDEELKKAYQNSFSSISSIRSRNNMKIANADDLKLIFNSIKFNHPGIRFGLKNVISFSDRLLRRELNSIF